MSWLWSCKWVLVHLSDHLNTTDMGAWCERLSIFLLYFVRWLSVGSLIARCSVPILMGGKVQDDGSHHLLLFIYNSGSFQWQDLDWSWPSCTSSSPNFWRYACHFWPMYAFNFCQSNQQLKSLIFYTSTLPRHTYSNTCGRSCQYYLFILLGQIICTLNLWSLSDIDILQSSSKNKEPTDVLEKKRWYW